MAGPCFDASVFALCCGPQSGSPLDQVPPLSGRQRLLRPSFPRPGHPEARSDMTTQPTGLVLRWDSHPLGECCCELQLSSAGITRPRRSYGPVRHPGRPGLALTGFRLGSRPHRSGLPVLRRISSADMPSPLPRWDRWVGSLVGRPIPTVPLSPATSAFPAMRPGRLPRLFFSRPARRSLALWPARSPSDYNRPLSRRLRRLRYLHRRSDSCRPERPRCRVGVAPTEDLRLSRRAASTGSTPWVWN